VSDGLDGRVFEGDVGDVEGRWVHGLVGLGVLPAVLFTADSFHRRFDMGGMYMFNQGLYPGDWATPQNQVQANQLAQLQGLRNFGQQAALARYAGGVGGGVPERTRNPFEQIGGLLREIGYAIGVRDEFNWSCSLQDEVEDL